MPDPYIALEQLNISDHGDARERHVWPLVSELLSEYEAFWRVLIVLLTNRVRPELNGSPEWIRLRPTIPVHYEKLAMHNYSLLYYMANARHEINQDQNRLKSGEFPCPEKVFFALQASVEQSKHLLESARNILARIGVYDRFPKHPEDLYQTIGLYRNALAHDPVLGRSIDSGRHLFPRQAHLKRKQPLLWRETEHIPADEMVDLLWLEEQIWLDFATFLQELWRSLAAAFRKARVSPNFVSDIGLPAGLPVSESTVLLSVTNPFAASGTNLIPAKKS